jgi:hypothetical protein
MPLAIRPVRLNKSIYVRVPSNIADLVDLDQQTRVTLSFERKDDLFLLIYSVKKQTAAGKGRSEGAIRDRVKPPKPKLKHSVFDDAHEDLTKKSAARTYIGRLEDASHTN